MGATRTAVLGGNHIQSWPRRVVNELIGLALLASALFIFVALVSFHESDPSINMAADHKALNWMGLPGAYIANPLLQMLGLASLLLVSMLAAWGWRLFASKRIPSLLSIRIAMFFISLVLLSVCFAAVEPPASWPIDNGLGGAIGLLVRHWLRHFFPGFIQVTLSLFLLLGALPIALGITWGEWRSMLRALWRSGLFALSIFSILRPARPEDMAYTNGAKMESRLVQFLKKLKPAAREDNDDEEEEAQDSEPKELAKKPRKQQVKKDLVAAPTRRAPKLTQQSSLELRPRKGEYQLPPVSLMNEPSRKVKKQTTNESALSQNARLLEGVLNDFGVNGEIVKVRPGPVVTLYELEPSPGTKSSRVIGLSDDISRSMSSISARIATVPGRNVIGIELPNQTRETVYLREMIEDEEFSNSNASLPIALGKDIGGTPIIVDLARMPHLLVAGTTGSGKSVAVNTMIASLIYKLTPEQCKFIMIDPKMLELSVYDNIPHLLSPVVTEPGKAVVALKWTVKEMENRYRLMSGLGVRNIDGYNKRIHEAKAKGDKLTRTVQTGFNPDTGSPIIEEVALDMNPLPFIVVVVDEMADLMLVAGKDIETSIQRLAQMARAAGIHIIMATQRPSVDVITGVIKANFPTRISFQVTSRIDSRTILGEQGAEQLLGQGDMLYMAGGGRITRVHGPFVSDKEVEAIVNHLKEQGAPTYVEDVTRDPEEGLALGEGAEGEEGEEGEIYRQAVAIVLRDRKASTSYLQRMLKLGYNRAARLVDRMEAEGIVGPANHVGKREVIG
jgi:S-DNA-T family DNA segregation ATPase FtsK/SpoIIIE